jgi:hypothetical protein
MYVPQKQNSCILVCDVAIGKMHENLSRPVKGKRDTVPDHIRPMRGYDVWCGWTIVVPSTARVVPVSMIVVSPEHT